VVQTSSAPLPGNDRPGKQADDQPIDQEAEPDTTPAPQDKAATSAGIEQTAPGRESIEEPGRRSSKELEPAGGTSRRYLLSSAGGAVLGAALGYSGKLTQEFYTDNDAADDLRVFDDDGPLSTVAIPEHVSSLQGQNWVLPEPLPAGEQVPWSLEDPTEWERWERWLAKHRAVDVTFTFVRVLVENRWSNDAVVTAIWAEVDRHDPLTGTFMSAPPQAAGAPVRLGFNLDTPSSQVQAQGVDEVALEMDLVSGRISPDDYLLNVPYLTKEELTLVHRDKVTIIAMAGGLQHYYEFKIHIEGYVGDKPFDQIVDNDGEPFRITAAPGYTKLGDGIYTMDTSGYEVVYEMDGGFSSWTRVRG
jgi:hypothetical protein